MKRIKYLPIIIAFTLIFNSCTDDFEEINTDPNRLESIGPSTLLNPVLYSLTNHNSYSAWHTRTAHFMQFIVPYPSNASGGYHRFDVTDDIGTTMWNNHYRWLKNIDEMEKVSNKLNDKNYEAIALTLKAWCFGNLTDVFGDIPFIEALKGDEFIDKPKFDKQSDIYPELLNYLEKANSLYNTNLTSVYAPDFLYANDFKKWQKLTNSLHLRLLLRISDVYPSAIEKINFILNNPSTYPIFTSNSDDAILINSGVAPNNTPWPRIQDYAADRKVSTFFIDNLLEMKDPRLNIWVTEAKDLRGNAIGYKGIPSGYGSNENLNYTPSSINNIPALAPMKNIVMTYAEVQFILAELQFKGLTPGNAVESYKKGVENAMNIWGITIPADYFDNSATEYNNTLERIMLQKYFALFFVDNQTWLEYRRTGYPKLPILPGLFNDSKMPVRYPYPANIKLQNQANYLTAIQQMGGDDINTRVWWDIN